MTQPAEAVKMTTPTHSEEMGKDVSLSSIEFPLTHYYELEGRVHTNQWSIPYKRDESLAICMVATIKMIREGWWGWDNGCGEGWHGKRTTEKG